MSNSPFVTEDDRGFRIQPGIAIVPVQQTFENILARDRQIEDWIKYLDEVVLWMVNELDTAQAYLGTGIQGGPANGGDVVWTELETTNSAEIDVVGGAPGSAIRLAAGHRYILSAELQHTGMGQNRQSVWQWHTGTSFVGTPMTVDGSADVGGAISAIDLTLKLTTPGAYTLRRLSGNALEGQIEALASVTQSSPDEPPPTAP